VNPIARVYGVLDIQRKLGGLESRVAKKVVRSSMRKTAKKVQATAKNNLLKQRSIVTGKLRKGLKVKAGKRSRNTISIRVQTTEGQHGDPGFGGAQVELGTKHAEAKSFLRPAIYDNERAINADIVADIRSVLNEISVGSAIGMRFLK
jgi:HK97 gp10 family phage protein